MRNQAEYFLILHKKGAFLELEPFSFPYGQKLVSIQKLSSQTMKLVSETSSRHSIIKIRAPA